MTPELTGKMLGQYQLADIAGRGGLATVYKAYQRRLERWVAVKVLHSDDEQLLARFEREAKAAARLQHRNILPVYEYDVAQDWPYIVMQFVAGGLTLGNYLKPHRPLAWSQVVMLSIRLAQALHYAHSHGLIHRDVKPSNILMPEPDWPLLADFGLVKVTSPGETITDDGDVVGTPEYMAPEQVDSANVDHRADIYSLGVVMFEMITGRLPFQSKHHNQIITDHIMTPPPAPRQFNVDCPPDLEEIILTALQKSPDDRYPDLSKMTGALINIFGGTMPVPSPAMPPPAHPNLAQAPGSSTHPSLRMARLVIQDTNTAIPLSPPGAEGLVIGRTYGPVTVDIDLTPYEAVEAGISRRHARLLHREQQWLIEDLGSMNGTYVNERKIPADRPLPLQNGDVVRCSMLSLRFLSAPG